MKEPAKRFEVLVVLHKAHHVRSLLSEVSKRLMAYSKAILAPDS